MKQKVYYFNRIKPILYELQHETIGPLYISKVYGGILMIFCFLSLETFHYFRILEFSSPLFINYFHIYFKD